MSKMKKMLVVFSVLVTVIAAGLVIAASTITAGKTVEVTSAQKFTAAALGKGTVLGTLAKGTTATVVSVQKDYARVKLSNSGLTGWVKSSGLKVITIKAPITVDSVAKISADWAASVHGTMPNLNAEANRDGCVQCHTGNGLESYVDKDHVYKGSTVLTAVKDAAGVQTGYSFDTSKVTIAKDLPRAIGCTSCHSGTGASIMKSGVIPAALNVFSSANNVQYTGTVDLKVGNSNAICLTCHNGRRDVKAVYNSWIDTDLANNLKSYPHHAWGALVSGLGGMEYPGETYKKNTAHQTQGCVGCHMGANRNHKMEAVVANCKTCHSTMTNFADFRAKSATMKSIDELAAQLNTLVLAKIPGAVKLGSTNSTFPATDKDGKQIVATTVSSAEALVGAYNYAIYDQEMTLGSKGLHNPSYLKSLLEVSIKHLQAAK